MQRIEDLFDMAEEEGFVFSWAFDPKRLLEKFGKKRR